MYAQYKIQPVLNSPLRPPKMDREKTTKNHDPCCKGHNLQAVNHELYKLEDVLAQQGIQVWRFSFSAPTELTQQYFMKPNTIYYPDYEFLQIAVRTNMHNLNDNNNNNNNNNDNTNNIINK